LEREARPGDGISDGQDRKKSKGCHISFKHERPRKGRGRQEVSRDGKK